MIIQKHTGLQEQRNWFQRGFTSLKPEFPDHITMPQSVAPQRVMA